MRNSVFSSGCNEAYKIRTSHQIRLKYSYIEAKSNNWPLRISCGLLYGVRRIQGYPAGNPRIIFWYLPRAPLNFSPPSSTRRVSAAGNYFSHYRILSLASAFSPPSSNSFLRFQPFKVWIEFHILVILFDEKRESLA